MLINAGGREQLIVWTGDTISSLEPTTFIATPLFQDDGHFYASMGDGHLGCLDATNGNEVWATQEPTGKRLGTVHITPQGDRVFLFNQVGNLILAKLTPAGYQELGRCLLVEPTAGYRAQGVTTWAHPAYANKHVFARSDRELICTSLAAADQPPPVADAKKSFNVRLIDDASQWDAPSVLAFSPNGVELATGPSACGTRSRMNREPSSTLITAASTASRSPPMASVWRAAAAIKPSNSGTWRRHPKPPP